MVPVASEIHFSGSLTGLKTSVMSDPVFFSVADLIVTMSGSYVTRGTLTVLTSATVIPLGAVTTPGWFAMKNTDLTNYLTLRNGAAGADVVQAKAGEYAFFRWPSTAVPYALANTSSVVMDYLLFSN